VIRWARIPLVPLAVAFATGIALAPWLAAWAPWTVGAVAGLATAGLVHAGRLGAAMVTLLAAITAAGVARGTPPPPAADHVARLPLPTVAWVEARIVSEPARPGRGRVRALAEVTRVDGEPRSGTVQLDLYGGRPPDLTPGQRVSGVLRLARPAGFRNPGGFDYAAHLARRDVHVTASGRGDDLTLEPAAPAWRTRVRRGAIAAMDAALPPASAALLAGLLLGERKALPAEIQEAFRVAGIYHVLAVSGFNVALVAGAVLGVLAFARVGHRAAALAAGAAVVGFAVVVGPEPSVVRATLMALVVLGARLLDRQASVVNGLAFAALVILAVRPGDLFDPGFQLSFAATLGIVVIPRPRGALAGALGVSVAAELAVVPITLAHFNQLSTLGPLANLGAVPLAALATVLGLLAAVVAFVVPALADPLFNATWPLLIAMRAVAAAVAWVPGALVYLPAPPLVAIGAYAAGLGLAVAAWHARRDRPLRAVPAGAAAACLLVAAVGLAAAPLLPRAATALRVSILDVGDADAVVVEPPAAGALVVEGGGGLARLDAMERIVAPFLWNRGILRLAARVRTRPEPEGGLADERRVPAREVWTHASFAAGPRRVGAALVSAVEPTGGEEGAGGGPARAATATGAPLVLRIDYGRASFLLAGDASPPIERALAAAGAPVAATVLLAPRHGARGSSGAAFLRAVAPTVTVVSAGGRGARGHPHPETLERLAAAGTRVFRTDRDGAVLLETDGRVLTVTAFASGARERYCLDPERDC
jgi:competence protein ComEC